MKAALLAALVACVAAAATATAAPPRSPGSVLATFVDAAHRGDGGRLWSLLSPASRARYGPSSAAFGKRAALELEDGLGSYDNFRIVLNEQLFTAVAVAAIAGERTVGGKREFSAYAAVLRLVKGAWRIELGAPVGLRPLGPRPGQVVGRQPQVAATIAAKAPISGAALWADGRAIDGRVGTSDPRHATVFGQAPVPLDPGRHTAVAMANAGAAVAAVAWTFVTR